MIRQLITVAVPLLAPVVLYLIYNWNLRRRGGVDAEGDPFSWRRIPWIWLTVCGTGLLALTLVTTSFVGRTGKSVQYEAPRFENGKRISGQFIK